MDRWVHQSFAREQFHAAVAKGFRRIIITSPTGGGKSVIIQDIVQDYLDRLEQVVLYLNRKILVDQSARDFVKAGVEFGVRSAGHQDEWEQPLQVASIQTQRRREDSLPLHRASLVVIDEAHMGEMKGKRAKAIIQKHLEMGAVILMVTATPLDMQDMADVLIVAGTNSELRACGALVPAVHYGASEPDFRRIKKVKPGEQLAEEEVSKAIMTKNIFGLVYDKWKQHNPARKPTLGFAPGVAESFKFAKDFWEKGVSTAHIDGEGIWVNGEWYKSDPDARKWLFDQHRDGKVEYIWSCFVMRTGVNLPWVECLQLATIITSLKEYLQIGGRGLRASPATGKQALTVIDHGGHYHRLGSLNQDRQWFLNWTSTAAAGLREMTLREKKCVLCRTPLADDTPKCPNAECGHVNEIEPFRCPKCDRVLNGRNCPCGHVIPVGRRSRMVVQIDGTMEEHVGDLYKPLNHRLAKGEKDLKDWEKCFWKAYKSRSKMTFAQAIGLFAFERDFKEWPSPDFKFMPKYAVDRFRRVCDVPRERLK